MDILEGAGVESVPECPATSYAPFGEVASDGVVPTRTQDTHTQYVF
jgi:hypothetical protein